MGEASTGDLNKSRQGEAKRTSGGIRAPLANNQYAGALVFITPPHDVITTRAAEATTIVRGLSGLLQLYGATRMGNLTVVRCEDKRGRLMCPVGSSLGA